MDNSNGSLYNMNNGPPPYNFARGGNNNLNPNSQGPSVDTEGLTSHGRPPNYQGYPPSAYEMEFAPYPGPPYGTPSNAYSGGGHPITPSYHQQQQQHFPTANARAYNYSQTDGPTMAPRPAPGGPGTRYSPNAHGYPMGHTASGNGNPRGQAPPSNPYRENSQSQSNAFRFVPPEYEYGYHPMASAGVVPSTPTNGGGPFMNQGPSPYGRPSPAGGDTRATSPNAPSSGPTGYRGPSPSGHAGVSPRGGPMKLAPAPHPQGAQPTYPPTRMPNRPSNGPPPNTRPPPTSAPPTTQNTTDGPTPTMAPPKKEENIQGFKSKAQEMKRKYLTKLEQMIKNMEDIKPSAKSEETKYKYEEIQKKLTLLRTLITADFKPNSNFPPRREILEAAEKQIIMWIQQWEKLERTNADSGVTIDPDSLDEMINQRMRSGADRSDRPPTHAPSFDGLDDLGLDGDLQMLFSGVDDLFGDASAAYTTPSGTASTDPTSGFLAGEPGSSSAAALDVPDEAVGEPAGLDGFFGESSEGAFSSVGPFEGGSSWDQMGDDSFVSFGGPSTSHRLPPSVGQKRYREEGSAGSTGKRDSRSSGRE